MSHNLNPDGSTIDGSILHSASFESIDDTIFSGSYAQTAAGPGVTRLLADAADAGELTMWEATNLLSQWYTVFWGEGSMDEGKSYLVISTYIEDGTAADGGSDIHYTDGTYVHEFGLLPPGVPLGSTWNGDGTWTSEDGTATYTQTTDGTWTTDVTGTEEPAPTEPTDDGGFVEPDPVKPAGVSAGAVWDGTRWVDVDTGEIWDIDGVLQVDDPESALDLESIADQIQAGTLTPEDALGLLFANTEFDRQFGSFDAVFQATIAPFLPGLSGPGQNILQSTSPFFQSGFNLQGAFAPEEGFNYLGGANDFLEFGAEGLQPLESFERMQFLQSLVQGYQQVEGGGLEYLASLGYSGEQALAIANQLSTYFDPNNDFAADQVRTAQIVNPFLQQASPFISGAMGKTFDYLQNQFNAERLASGNPTTSYFSNALLTGGSFYEDFLKAMTPEGEPGGFDFLSPNISF